MYTARKFPHSLLSNGKVTDGTGMIGDALGDAYENAADQDFPGCRSLTCSCRGGGGGYPFWVPIVRESYYLGCILGAPAIFVNHHLFIRV